MYTVKEVSKKYNIKENTILNAIRTNKLTAKKVGKSYRITSDAIETYLGLSNKYDPYILKRLKAVIDAEQHFYRFKESYYRLENMNERANDYKILIKCNENLIKSILKN